MPRFRSKLSGSVVNVPSADGLGAEYVPVGDGEPAPAPREQPAAPPAEESPPAAEKPPRSSRK